MESVFLDYGTVSDGDLDVSALTAQLPRLQIFDFTDDAALAARIRGAEAVLINGLKMTGAHMAGAARLKLIALAATGTDNVDLDEARRRGIAVCNVRGYCTAAVVQHAWAMILQLTQRLKHFESFATGGAWASGTHLNPSSPSIRELAGRTLGIVGWGDLGRGVARIGEAFGLRVLVAGRPGAAPVAGRLALAELLRAADIVSLHCPLNDATRGMIGARELALMKSDALLINTARGALVDAAALAQALRAGRLGGAGIDVLAQEPPLDGSPLLDPGLPNLVVTPHVAWAAREARQRCIDEMAANIADFSRGGSRGRVV